MAIFNSYVKLPEGMFLETLPTSSSPVSSVTVHRDTVPRAVFRRSWPKLSGACLPTAFWTIWLLTKAPCRPWHSQISRSEQWMVLIAKQRSIGRGSATWRPTEKEGEHWRIIDHMRCHGQRLGYIMLYHVIAWYSAILQDVHTTVSRDLQWPT